MWYCTVRYRLLVSRKFEKLNGDLRKYVMNEKLNRILSILPETSLGLPEIREDFDKNQLSITPEDRVTIDSLLGRVVADEVLRMQREQHTNGGINPAVNVLLFPSELGGGMDMDALQIILANHIVWRETLTY